MSLRNWIDSNVEYGRRLALSGAEGAGAARQNFLNHEPLPLFLNQSLATAFKHATAGACVGILGAYLSGRRRSTRRALAYGALGGAVGFGAGLSWRTHRLAAGMGRGALKQMSVVRNERWLERHPINYA